MRQRQQCRCRPSAFFTSYEEPVLPSDGKGSDGSFGWIIVEAGRGVLGIVLQVRDERAKISQGLFKLRFGKDDSFCQSLFDSFDHCIDDWDRLGLSKFDSLFGRLCPSGLFYLKKFLDLFEYPCSESGVSCFGFKKLSSDVRKTRRPDVLVFPDVGLVCAILVGVDDSGVRPKEFVDIVVFAILLKAVVSVRGGCLLLLQLIPTCSLERLWGCRRSQRDSHRCGGDC